MADKSKRQKVLLDHKKVGKRYIPPMLQLGSMVETKWADTGLPDFFWIAMIIDKHGLKRGTELSLAIARTFEHPAEGEHWPKSSLTLSSTYAQFSQEDKEKIKRKLSEQGCLQEIQTSLCPLVFFYPEFPLGFLCDHAKPTNPEFELIRIKQLVNDLYNKRGRKATLVLTTAFYIEAVIGRITIAKGVADHLSDLEAVLEYPKTDLSRKIAATVRAMSQNLSFDNDEVNRTWCNYFWNRGFELEPCILTNEENNEAR